ncbi:MAG: L-histidine N(alpha)-methyltransferase [Verrucomicrobia bacterium]|nr:L-histidine N(alpha)-methyltransferase [Verrucomicrobiota bacterium]
MPTDATIPAPADATTPTLMPVLFHASQFPEGVRQELRRSLQTRRVNHKFHYDSVKQTARWLALHEAWSPARRDADCTRIYAEASAWLAEKISAPRVVLASIGCGGGHKDVQILRRLLSAGKPAVYLPVDVSPAMVLVAAQAAGAVLARRDCHPVVLDFALTEDLPGVISSVAGDEAARVLAFFGMLPNFEPHLVLPRLAAALRPGEFLALSANLAPGRDCESGTRAVLPQYDNPPTREWLLTFLHDLGFDPDDGKLVFRVEPVPGQPESFRITAHFELSRERTIRVEGEEFRFAPGESIRIFFSCRYTPGQVKAMLAAAGLEMMAEWITARAEEGVFVCRRA